MFCCVVLAEKIVAFWFDGRVDFELILDPEWEKIILISFDFNLIIEDL